MGNIYKRGKILYIDIRVKGRRIRKRIGTSKKIAELALKDAEVKTAKDEFGFVKNDIPLVKFIGLFLDYSRANHRQTTTDRYRAVMDNFYRFLDSKAGTIFISEITPELIERYKMFRKSSWLNANGQHLANMNSITSKTRKGARSNTINFELDALRLIFNRAIEWDYLKINPTKKVKRLKVDDSKPVRFLTKEECRRLLNAATEPQYPVFYTGTRGMIGKRECLKYGICG